MKKLKEIPCNISREAWLQEVENHDVTCALKIGCSMTKAMISSIPREMYFLLQRKILPEIIFPDDQSLQALASSPCQNNSLVRNLIALSTILSAMKILLPKNILDNLKVTLGLASHHLIGCLSGSNPLGISYSRRYPEATLP